MNPLFNIDLEKLKGLFAGLAQTSPDAGVAPATAEANAATGGLLSGLAQAAPGSLRRGWEGSDLRQGIQNAIDTASYYAGPHLSDRAQAAGSVAPMLTPKFGTDDARAAREAFGEGQYGRGAGLMGLGVAGGLLDAIPGEAGVKGLLQGLNKAAHYGPDLGMAAMGGAGAIKAVSGERVVGSGPIKAYHGSPHDFPSVAEIMFRDGRPSQTVPLGQRLDPQIVEAIQKGYITVKEHPLGRFDLSRIGTGEGAQSYGHGLYFAENEQVAKGYRDTLAARRIQSKDGGVLADPFTEMSFAARKVNPDNWKEANRIADELVGALGAGDDLNHMSRFVQKSDWVPETKAMYAAAIERAKGFHVPPGRMYEVNIHADPERFLDWDKPIAAQPQTLQNLARERGVPLDRRSTGADIYADLERLGPAQAASLLRDQGIPGIKYLDAGSRGAADGSRNYVTFRDDILEILRKYGLAGLGLGVPAAMAAQQQQGLFPLPQRQ